MAHYCICPKCSQRFDRDKIQSVKIGARRYGHASCYPDNTELVPMEVAKPKGDPDLAALNEYIDKIFKGEQNKARTKKYIQQFHNEMNYFYSGILKSLIYHFEIQNGSIEKANKSIGIVPYIYDEAKEYYYKLYMASSANENVDAVKVTSKEKEVVIKEPRRKTSFLKKLFDLGD